MAGPVLNGEATLTNVPWRVRAAEVAAAVGVADVRLLNDLEAMAHAVPVLAAAELHTLQAGQPNPEGNAALIAAGTGLGEAILHRVGGRMLPVPSEAGHSDFAVRTDDEAAFWRFLRDRFGRVDIEHVLSGPGIVRLAEFTHGGGTCPTIGDFVETSDGAARVYAAAGECAECRRALAMFVDAYGGEAGNLGLRAVATAGLYVGGGIAPKILPALQHGAFLRPFLAKPPMHGDARGDAGARDPRTIRRRWSAPPLPRSAEREARSGHRRAQIGERAALGGIGGQAAAQV